MGGNTCSDPPPPQDSPLPQDSPPPQNSPPPRSSSHSQDKRVAGTLSAKCLPQNATSWQPFKKLHFSTELEVTEHEVFVKDGRERMLLVGLPLNDLLPNESPTLISLTTLWFNILLRKAVRMKHWCWAYVLHILNNEAASVTFDELFRESIHYSQGDVTTQVFLSVLQNESLQDELFNFLQEFAQKLVAKGGALGLHKLKNVEIMVSYGVMESSELKVEFDYFMRGGYQRVLQACTTPDSSDEPSHITAYLTILLDDDDVFEKCSKYSGGESQPLEMCRNQHTPHATSKSQRIKVEEVEQGISQFVSTGQQMMRCHVPVAYSSNENVTVATAKSSTTDDSNAASYMSAGTPQNQQRPQQESEEDRDTSGVESMSDSESSDSSSSDQDRPPRWTQNMTGSLQKSCQVISNTGKSTFKRKQTNALLRHGSSSKTDLEQVSHHEFGNLQCSFGSTAQKGTVSAKELLPSGQLLNMQPGSSTSCSPLSVQLYSQSVCDSETSMNKSEMKDDLNASSRNAGLVNVPTSFVFAGIPQSRQQLQKEPDPNEEDRDTSGIESMNESSDSSSSDQDRPPRWTRNMTNFASLEVKSSGHTMQSKGNTAFKQPVTDTIFKHTTSSESDFEQVCLSNPTCSCGKNVKEILPEELTNMQPAQTGSLKQCNTLSVSLPLCNTSEQVVSSTEQQLRSDCATACRKSSQSLQPLLSKEADNHCDIQEIIHAPHPEAKSEKTNILSDTSSISGPSPPQMWDVEIPQNCSDLAKLETFIQSLPAEVLVPKDVAKGKTLCHALVLLLGKTFSSAEVTHLLELLGEKFLQWCMMCQDSSGNTPLHCAIETKNASADVFKFLLKFATRESVMILNNDKVTALELSFETRLWPITQLLIEHQIETGASCVAELLQEYIFKSMTIQGGNLFLPQLLDLREHHCANFDLNFCKPKSSRTPWWYLANSSDPIFVERVLQTLKDHSIDFTSLHTQTDNGHKKNLVEEASDMKQLQLLHTMIQIVTERKCSEKDRNLPEKHEANMRHISSSESELEQLGFSNPTRSFSATAGTSEVLHISKATTIQEKGIDHANELQHPVEPPDMETVCTEVLSTELSDKSCESSSEGGTTSLEADDSSDGGSGGTLRKAKRLTRRSHNTIVKHRKTIPVRGCCHGAKKQNKSSLLILYKHSDYTGDDSDHKSEHSRTKSFKFTRAQRAAGMRRKRRLYKSSSSEYSEAETDPQVWKDIDEEFKLSVPNAIKLIIQSSFCAIQLFNCLPLLTINSTPDSRMSTELHHAVRRQSLQSVRNILACDGGEDQIQMMDEEGHTPLQIASQNKDLNLFELLLESLVRSQGPSFVTLPPISGHQKMTLLASIVKVLSNLKIDIDDSTLHWIMIGCQHWKIPTVVYATPLTMTLSQFLRSYHNQLLINKLLKFLRTGSKKKRFLPKEITADPTSSHATTDRTAEDSCLHLQPKSSSVQFTHKQGAIQELAAVEEQGIPFQSEMVYVTCRDDLILIRAYTNSLVTGLTLLHSKGLGFHQMRTIPPHQSTKPPYISTTAKKPNSADPTFSPAITDRSKLTHVVPDSPSRFQSKSSAPEPIPHSQIPQLPAPSPKPTNSQKEVTAWWAWINKAVDCLHAGYYSQMLEVLKFGKVPPPLPPEIAMAAQFGCALAYYKLEKYSEAAKHLESLKTHAASAQSCGNESIASVYLGDIEFTQSRYTEAAKHYSHALKLYKSDNLGKEYRLIVPTFSAISAKLGTAFRNTSKVVDAVQAYRQAIATADSKKDKLSAHTSLGNLFQSVGENASALAEYEHSIKLSEELRDYVSLGWAHGNMGNAYLGLYQRDKGLYHLEKALDLTVEHEPTPQAIGRAYNNLGTAYQALNELDKAEEKYDLALSQSIYGNDLPGQARVYGNIGNVLMLRKDYDRAVPHYTEVLRLSRDRSTVSTAFHNRGCSYYEWAESKKATLPQKVGFSLHGAEFENCEVEHQPSFKSLPNSILKYYQLGRQDLEQVIKYHEETFENIKGSSKGLTLSVSLFETNSRTFHRLQDCLVNLGEWEKALVVAEQSRTRTLGELLVKRKNSKIDHPLTAPLNLQSITDIVQSQHSVVVYLSYTGARLLGWVLAPTPDKVSVDMFEVPLEDDQFDGKSFDYHLRYSLTEELVERSFEMYRAVDYKSDMSEPVRKLYKLVCKPLMKILKELKDPDSTSGVQEMIIIPDSYTCLLPFPCLLDEEDEFLGDSYSFRIMPSLLTMGIVDQLPSVVVQVPADGRSMCVVGNPTIPSFVYNGDQWSLGKLPFATREAEWVANILKTTPILHEQATKDAVLMRIMNAKVIHIATHGSASAGFLAFAGMSSARNGETVEAKNVLLYPEDIERLSISPALVVLSSCDSARGTVKADGILGMARAFILAGAQAVLTTLWRVPDESASVFMQFFYQYLMDGLKASLALQKSTLSVRCFSKYSQYIHWSGYQLTGREIQFDITKPSTAASLEARLGKSSVFPRLDVVQQLESAFLKDPCASSDVQILRGPPGVKPSEPLVDFIHSFHDAFKGGIFWINGKTQEFVEASDEAIDTRSTALSTHPVLIVFDYINQLPQFSTSLFELLKQPNTHIVVISKTYTPPDALVKEIDNQLLRGCNIIDVKPLPPIHTTQRIVHSILSAYHLAPTNEDQNIFEKLAEFTSGSPALIDVTAALFLSQMEQDSHNESQGIHDTLVNFSNRLSLDEMDPSAKPVTVVRRAPPKGTAKTREISNNVYDNIVSIRDPEQDPWCTSSPYDSWQAVTTLIDQCSLSAEEKLLLFAVSMFSCSPVPMSVVTEVSSMIATASQKPHISTSLHSKLFQMQLMKRYPLPVILHSIQQSSTEPEIFYVPHYIARAVWKDMMSDRDKVVALVTMYMALRTLADNPSSSDSGFLKGLISLLMELYELNYELMGKQCYQEVYKLYLQMKPKDGNHPTPPPDTGATPHLPTPAPDTGVTLPYPTPAPNNDVTPLQPIPTHNTGAIPPHPTQDPDTGTTLSHPTPASDTGAPPHRPTPAPQTARDLTEYQSLMIVAEMKRPRNMHTHT